MVLIYESKFTWFLAWGSKLTWFRVRAENNIFLVWGSIEFVFVQVVEIDLVFV